MSKIQYSKRQLKIIEIVKENQPITGESIAESLNVTRATIRSDLAVLTMTGVLDARPKVGYFYSGENKVNLNLNRTADIKIGDIMSVPVVANQDDNVYEVIVNMFLSDVGNIIILDNGELCGVVSRKDLLKCTIGGSDIEKMPVGLIMTRTPNVITVTESDNILTAARRILTHEVDFLPVIRNRQKNGQELVEVVGRISKTNITKIFVEMFE